jgi:hypothetical protein
LDAVRLHTPSRPCYLEKKQKFLTVVSNLETGEPLWFGRERKKETLDEFFQEHLSAFQRRVIRAACVDTT